MELRNTNMLSERSADMLISEAMQYRAEVDDEFPLKPVRSITPLIICSYVLTLPPPPCVLE